jgi:hypothetical protein
MLTLILLNFPVILFALAIISARGKHLSSADKFLTLFLVYFSYIIIAEQSLGIIGLLTLRNLFIVNLCVLCSVCFFHRKLRVVEVIDGYTRRLISELKVSRFTLFVLAVIIGFSLAKLYVNLINPPFGWDSLNYHFTFAVEWLKNKNLSTPLVVSDIPCPTYFPLNGSLIYLWFIYPFHNVFLADLGQAPFYFMALLAIYSICRKLDVSREIAFLAAVVMAITPNYFKQLSIAYVDLMVCAWFLLALNYLLSFYEDANWENTCLFSLSLGMLIGTKTMGLTYGFILVLFFLYLIVRKLDRKGIYKIATFAILLAVTGGFSYIRNFVLTGNPLYPLSLKFNSLSLPGVMEKSNFVAFVNKSDFAFSTMLFHEGLGAGTLIFIIPGLLLFLYGSIVKRRIAFREVLLIACFIFIYVVYRYVISVPNVRYFYPALGVGFIMAFVALSNIRLPIRILKIIVAICVLASIPELAKPKFPEFTAALITTLFVFIILLGGFRFVQKRIVGVGLLCVLAVLVVLTIESRNYRQNEFSRYAASRKYSGFWPDAVQAWAWLSQKSDGNNIAYVGRPVPLPLYGRDLRNNVYYCSVNGIDPMFIHYQKNAWYSWDNHSESMHRSFEEPNNYRGGANYDLWLRNLRKRKTDYLFIYSLHQTKNIAFPIEEKWASAHPAIFKLVYNNDTIHIYKLTL